MAFWASYPATDLSALDLAATSIYGTNDPGAARMSGPEARAKLPPDTVFVPIEGGNHEQMGWYTGQPADGIATISREEQQRQVVDATATMLASIAPPAP
jgi:Alpha/beta hydrolase family